MSCPVSHSWERAGLGLEPGASKCTGLEVLYPIHCSTLSYPVLSFLSRRWQFGQMDYQDNKMCGEMVEYRCQVWVKWEECRLMITQTGELGNAHGQQAKMGYRKSKKGQLMTGL